MSFLGLGLFGGVGLIYVFNFIMAQKEQSLLYCFLGIGNQNILKEYILKGVRMNIQELIDKKIAEEQAKHAIERVPSGKFVPSKLGKCYRAQIFYRKNEPVTNPPDERTLRKFRAGHLFHEFVHSLLQREPGYRAEVEFENENWKGRADFVLNDAVGEVKSQHSRAFWYMAQQKDEADEDYTKRIIEKKLPDILQATIYAVKLSKPNINLIYISKDDLCIRQFDFETLEFKDDLDNELVILQHFWNKDELPPAIPRAYKDKEGKSNECKFCSWYSRCKEIK